MTFPILGGNSAVTGAYSIDNSLRFNDGDSAYLSRTQTAGNRRTWTWSGWVKRGVVDTRQNILSAGNDGNDESHFRFDATGYIRFKESTNNSPEFLLDTNELFRDPAAWYHFVIAVDTTQSTDSDRIKIYKNGSQITTFNSPNYPSQNYETRWNNNSQTTYLGLNVPAYPDYFDGYMAEVHFIDGTAKSPTDFGEFDSDSGIWKPIRYSGSYGTNGFYLPFNNIGQTHNITAYGDVHHETDAQKIGATSIEFDGTGDYLSLDDKSQFKFGSGDFTIEFFAKMGDQANTYTTLFNDPSGGNKLRVDTGGSTTAPKLSFYSSAWDERTSGTTDLSDNAWHHCAIVRDNGTLRIFVDGTQEATRASSTQDVDSSGVFEIGRYNSGTRYFDGYLDEIRISNVARYTGSFTPTTSAFTKDDNTRLLIHSNSSDGNTTFTDDSGSDGGIGDDASGNNNDFTTTNINDFTDQMLDTPTKNFCTLNSTRGAIGSNSSNTPLFEGNLKALHTDNAYKQSEGTIFPTAGKWYWETLITNSGTDAGALGIVTSGQPTGAYPGTTINGYGYDSYGSGSKIHNNSRDNSYGTSYSANDIMGTALDLDNGTLTFYKNNTSQGQAYSGIDASLGWGFGQGSYYATNGIVVNFGQDSSFAGNKTAQNNSDANGEGDFYYTPPSGFLALNSTNLATELSPTIDDGSAHFHTQLYTGNDSARTITNDANAGDFQPDWVWAKHRNNSTGHSNNLVDSSRGGTKTLYSNTTDKEETITNGVTGFATDGFTLGTNASINQSSINYKAWQWKANAGTTSSNTDGDITTTVQANTTSGFSILTWTGNGSASQQLGHGLGTTPKFFINKNRDVAGTWQLFGSTEFDRMQFNGEAEDENLPCGFSSTTITLPAIAANSEFNSSGDNFVSYVISEVEGFSRIGTYIGNGVTGEGSFVYCGFKPQFLMIKSLSASSDGWAVFDSARDPYNGVQYYEFVNNGSAEGSGTIRLDFLSNGFKLRQSGSSWNGSNVSYFFYAIASNPFVTSSGVPNTAR